MFLANTPSDLEPTFLVLLGFPQLLQISAGGLCMYYWPKSASRRKKGRKTCQLPTGTKKMGSHLKLPTWKKPIPNWKKPPTNWSGLSIQQWGCWVDREDLLMMALMGFKGTLAPSTPWWLPARPFTVVGCMCHLDTKLFRCHSLVWVCQVCELYLTHPQKARRCKLKCRFGVDTIFWILAKEGETGLKWRPEGPTILGSVGSNQAISASEVGAW